MVTMVTTPAPGTVSSADAIGLRRLMIRTGLHSRSRCWSATPDWGRAAAPQKTDDRQCRSSRRLASSPGPNRSGAVALMRATRRPAWARPGCAFAEVLVRSGPREQKYRGSFPIGMARLHSTGTPSPAPRRAVKRRHRESSRSVDVLIRLRSQPKARRSRRCDATLLAPVQRPGRSPLVQRFAMTRSSCSTFECAQAPW